RDTPLAGPAKEPNAKSPMSPNSGKLDPEKPVQNSDGRDFTLGEAIRTGAFWLFAGAGGAFNLVASGLGLFNEAVLAERGFDRKSFHIFLAASSLMSLAGQFLCGWLTRRYKYQTLVGFALFLYAISLGVIPLITQHWHLWALAAFMGVAGGMII